MLNPEYIFGAIGVLLVFGLPSIVLSTMRRKEKNFFNGWAYFLLSLLASFSCFYVLGANVFYIKSVAKIFLLSLASTLIYVTRRCSDR